MNRNAPWVVMILMLSPATHSRAATDVGSLKQAATGKWRALIVASAPEKGGLMATMTCGCFVDESGLAVLDLLAFSGARPAKEFFLTDHTKLGKPVLRLVSRDPAIAIVKFDHKPHAWIEPDAREVKTGLEVALIDPMQESPLLTGPIVARTMAVGANQLVPAYQPILSIGAGLPLARQQPPMNGAALVDADGRLRGMYSGIRLLGTQTLIYASPVDRWPEAIEKARRSKESIGYPVPQDLTPYDPVSTHPDYLQAIAAFSSQQFAQAIRHVHKALEDHPKSLLLRGLEFDIAMQSKSGDYLQLAAACKPESDNPALNSRYYLYLARAHLLAGDSTGAGKAYEQAIQHSPKHEVMSRWEYSRILESEDKLEEALRLRGEAVEHNPENIQMLGSMQTLLERLGKTRQSDQINERIYQLEELYRRK